MRTYNLRELGFPNITVSESGVILDEITGKICEIKNLRVKLDNHSGLVQVFTHGRLVKACFDPPWMNGIFSVNLGFLNLSNYFATEDGRIFGIRNVQYISPNLTHDGYCTVNLTTDSGDYMPWRLHRLIAMAFIPNPEGKDTVNHIDGNRRNNHPSNLEWSWMWENIDHRRKMNNSVTDEQLHAVCRLLTEGYGYVSAARKVGVPAYVAKDLLRGSYHNVAKNYAFKRYADQSRSAVDTKRPVHLEHNQKSRKHLLSYDSSTTIS